MSRPLHVLIVAPEGIGGQQIQAAGLIAHLGANGSPVRMSFQSITPRLPGPLRLLQRVRYVRTVAQTVALVSLLLVRVRRADVVHVFAASHWSFLLSATPPILVARLYGRKAVLNYHTGAAQDHLARWRRTAVPVMRMADVVVAPSPTVAGVLERHGVPARTLANAIDPMSFRRREPLRPVFLTSRALSERYNVGCVLRAFALIQERVPGARLIVAGDGPERGPLERLAADLGLRDVRFAGWVAPERRSELYDEADVYLNGSDLDNAPLSLLEAGAAGLPVVTTDAGGIPDLVEDGVSGMLVPRRDPAAMADAALALLADRELADALIEAARRRSLEHTWDAAGERWLALYRELARA